MEQPPLQDREKKQKLLARLSRVNGQVAGVRRMVERDQPCEEIAQQLAAARAALDKSYFELMACALEASVLDAHGDDESRREAIDALTQLLVKYA